ncbi:MAG: type II toxin-antitoxin system RelE/ParE family toxin [Candidatus Aminicenantes bacterium]|nr:type II toxin-antitoxin system RelE/ParE family toxin [Candidatus Aminicenantes bacterium]
MARFDVLIKPSAVKEIETIASMTDRRRIAAKIRRLADDPSPPGCRKLSGRDRYRIRVGVCRILYSIRERQHVVFVVKVGHRKNVYH